MPCLRPLRYPCFVSSLVKPGGKVITLTLPLGKLGVNFVKGQQKKLANRVFESLQELEAALMEALKEFWERAEVVISLTAYP